MKWRLTTVYTHCSDLMKPHPSPLQLQTKQLSLVEVGRTLVDERQLRLRVHQLLRRLRCVAKTNGCVDRGDRLELWSRKGSQMVTPRASSLSAASRAASSWADTAWFTCLTAAWTGGTENKTDKESRQLQMMTLRRKSSLASHPPRGLVPLAALGLAQRVLVVLGQNLLVIPQHRVRIIQRSHQHGRLTSVDRLVDGNHSGVH
ncbi:hypothetical protein EYF80_015510 [Liparis tanakae]|uniref:Uncharacterized protein n=1 Tax=Liparis tanakae TaxID=230148 RepID=A0A4Z2I8E8_9TELE|nr:hypothetical protein EYF80_015510 [Liparis tanakae]